MKKIAAYGGAIAEIFDANDITTSEAAEILYKVAHQTMTQRKVEKVANNLFGILEDMPADDGVEVLYGIYNIIKEGAFWDPEGPSPGRITPHERDIALRLHPVTHPYMVGKDIGSLIKKRLTPEPGASSHTERKNITYQTGYEPPAHGAEVPQEMGGGISNNGQNAIPF